MKVGIDARFITRHPRRGIGNYSLNLVKHLISLDTSVQYILYIYEHDKDLALPKSSNVSIRKLRVPFYPIWEQVALPIVIAKDKVDILHCLGNTAPLFIIPSSARLVLTVHDVMFLQSGEFIPIPKNTYQALGRLYRAFISPRCMIKSDAIITVSEYSRSDILKFIPKLGPEKVLVSHQSCNKMSSLLTEQCFPSMTPYVFALGADDPRKNTIRLVKAYLSLLKKYNIEENLVISGYANWERSEAYKLVKKAKMSERVIFLSYVSNEYLAFLYQNAELFIYPSLYEGFGIPLLEAFSAGCPVIASNVTSIPEVGGDAIIYIDPNDCGKIGESILKLLKDYNLRKSLIERGYIQASKFTWEKTAQKTLSIYKHVLKESL